MAALIQFDVNAFYAAFPPFQGTITQDALQIYWDTASIMVDPTMPQAPYVARQTRYLQLMTAHLATLNIMIMGGNLPGIITAATIDKVSVTLQPPPEKNQFQWWLNQTPYGQQLAALTQIATIGGFFVGGLPETSAFRKVGGIF